MPGSAPIGAYAFFLSLTPGSSYQHSSQKLHSLFKIKLKEPGRWEFRAVNDDVLMVAGGCEQDD
jgi:hypothetical protein